YYNQNQSKNLSQDEWVKEISSVFAKDIILSALIQYKEIRTLQFGEYFAPAVKTIARLTPIRNASNAVFFIAETIDGKTVEMRFIDDLKATGYESYDKIKNALLNGLSEYASLKYRFYSLKDEKKINKWIEDNERKLIISHFNDKLYADFGISQLSDKNLEKSIFKNYAYDFNADKKDALFTLLKNNAEEIAAWLLKQKPNDAEKINKAKQEWLDFQSTPANKDAKPVLQIEEKTIIENPEAASKEESVIELAQNYIASNIAISPAAPDEESSVKVSKLIDIAGYLDIIYQNDDYGLYSLLGAKGFIHLSQNPQGEIIVTADANAAFDASLNVKKLAEKIIQPSKETQVNADEHIKRVNKSLVEIGCRNVVFHEDALTGGYFTFVYSYKGRALSNYIVYPFKNAGFADENAVSKAELITEIFKWLIDKGYNPRYVNDDASDRSQYFVFAGNIKLYLYSHLGDRALIRKNSVYFDLEREVQKAVIFEKYKNAIARIYNMRGYGSKITQLITLTNNITIEEAYLGNLLYWCLPDGSEFYPENYDGSIVPFDEMIAAAGIQSEEPQKTNRAHLVNLDAGRVNLQEIAELSAELTLPAAEIAQKAALASTQTNEPKTAEIERQDNDASKETPVVSDQNNENEIVEISETKDEEDITPATENDKTDARSAGKTISAKTLSLIATLFALPFILLILIKHKKFFNLALFKHICAQTLSYAQSLSNAVLDDKKSSKDIINKGFTPQHIKNILHSA
ncbi:MAG: hypothetical protein LBQ47_01380, partial [Endomicrobium sp.]|nr:hypothetical protein [Endomicrobium sp.]